MRHIGFIALVLVATSAHGVTVVHETYFHNPGITSFSIPTATAGNLLVIAASGDLQLTSNVFEPSDNLGSTYSQVDPLTTEQCLWYLSNIPAGINEITFISAQDVGMWVFELSPSAVVMADLSSFGSTTPQVGPVITGSGSSDFYLSMCWANPGNGDPFTSVSSPWALDANQYYYSVHPNGAKGALATFIGSGAQQATFIVGSSDLAQYQIAGAVFTDSAPVTSAALRHKTWLH